MSHSTRPARRRRRFFAGWRFVPACEQLEERRLLSTFNETEPNSTVGAANLISVPTGDILTTAAADWLTINGSVGVGADLLDYFQFTLSAAAGVFFDIDSQDIGLSTTLDSILRVFDSSGTLEIANNLNGFDFEGFAAPATSTNSPQSLDASLYLDMAPGTYYVRASNAAGTSGDYQLRILADTVYTSAVPVLNSFPEATSDTLYLDFDGHVSAGDSWGVYTAAAFDFNGNVATFSPAERLAIKNTWRVVSEDYSPFKINVSTVVPATIGNGVGFRQIITSSSPTIVDESSGILGVAFLRSYAGGSSLNNVAFTFASNFPTYAAGISGRIMASALEMGNTTSHEFGHALGLLHFNTNAPPSVSAGNATQIPNGIMATPDQGYNREIWVLGQADDDGINTIFQDDVATISNTTNTFGYRNDDYAGTSIGTAQPLVASGNTYSASGVIEQLTDVDFFGFIGSGATTVRVDVDEYVNNLDAELRLYDSAGVVLLTADLSTSFDAVLTQTLASGTYYVEVRSDQETGEMGQYTLQIDTSVIANRAPTRTAAAATLASVAEDTTAPAGESVANVFGGLFADLDGTTIATGGVAIVASAATPAQGTWQVKVGTQTFVNLPALVDSTAAVVLRATDLIRFVPAQNFNGTPGSLTARMWDGTGQIAASNAAQNISSAIGGSGAFSDNANLVTLSTEITAVNDAPTRIGAGDAVLAAVLEDTTILPGRSVSNLLGGMFADLDGTTLAAGGAAIVGSGVSVEEGTWQVKVGGGAFVDLSLVLDDTEAVVVGAGDLIRFVPALHFNGVPGGLTLRLWDGTGGFAASPTPRDISASLGSAGGFSDDLGQVFLSTIVRAVNDAPTGGDDSLPDISEDSGALAISLAALLGNDLAGPANESGESLAITAISDVVGGTAEIVGDEVIFMPADDYNGPAGFSYVLFDNGQTNGIDDFLSSVVVVSFAITPTNDAPQAVNDALASAAEDSVRAIAFAELIGNDSASDTNEGEEFLTIVEVGDAAGGMVEIVGNEVIFTPESDYIGPASFRYTLRDNGQTNGQDDFQTDSAIVSFEITPVNDAPSGANDSLPAMFEDSGARTIAFSALVGNDATGPADENVQTLTVVAVDDAVGGTVEIVAGEVIFTPSENYNGPASFGYTLRDDGQTNGLDDFLTNTAVASFTVDAVNDSPRFAAGPDQSVSDEEYGGSESSVITFDGLSGVTGRPLTAYVEDGFQVTPITGRWVQAHISVLANPIPGIYGDTATATLEVTRPAGGIFSFAGFDLASGDDAGPVDPVGYTVVGLRGGQTVFSGTGNVGVKQFTDVASPSNALIDTLRFSMLRLNAQAYLLDNIRLVAPPSQVIFGWATMLAAGPLGASDEAGQKLSFSVSNDNNDLFIDQPAVDASGTLTYSPKPNVRGTAQVTVMIRDNGGADNGGSDTSEATIFLVEVTKELPRHNIVKGLDVTGDGSIVAEDALAVINYLNAFGSQEFAADSPVGPEFYDTSGDGHIAPGDALDVINFLNAFGPDVEGEPAGLPEENLFAGDDSSPYIAAQALLSDDLAALLAVDAALQPRRRR